MKLILVDKPIEFLLPYAVTRQAIDQLKVYTQDKLDKNTSISNAINFFHNTDWYKPLKPIE